MGFFTSKKIEPDASFMDADNKSVVQTIRSRFYGKSKGKEREVISSPVVSSHFLGIQRSGDKTVVPVKVKAQGAAVLKKERPSTGALSIADGTKPLELPKNPPGLSKPSTDPMTATLAQRLNELAVSNSEGLLNDEEYRLLRQNLFERFAGGATVPSEVPVVPLASLPRHSVEGRPSMSSSNQARPSSQFHVDPIRTPSLRKKPSMASTVSTIFRRASRRQSSSGLKDSSAASDASSVFSMSSSTSNAFHRGLPRKDSNASIRTEFSRTPYDPPFISRLGNSNADQSLALADSTSRSTTRSLRRMAAATPPSSFTARISGTETIGQSSKPVSSINMQDVFDDENLRTARDIRHEIGVVEAEGRRLMDAFNGLELSTLTRRQNQPPRLPPVVSASSDGSRSHNGDGSNWTLTSDRKRRGTEGDAISIRSNTSAGTTLSAAKSQHSKRTPATNKSVSLLRKSSFSSVSSRGNSIHGLPPIPPLPSTSSNLGHLGVGSSSSVNLARSTNNLPLPAVAESEIVDRRSFAEARPNPDQDDGEIVALEIELADIRKRRGEVTARYEARLEYLRAKLKGAELHEKLLRK